jgi:hypothetical protein
MSPAEELRLFGWAIGAGLFLSLLGGVLLRLRTRRRQRSERPLTDRLLGRQRDAATEARRWRESRRQ